MHHCAICGSYPTIKNIILCAICERQSLKWFFPDNPNWIRDERNILDNQIDFAKAQVGFIWPPNEARAKVHLLHALKGRSCEMTWKLMAHRFVERQYSVAQKTKHKRWLLLPIPSRHQEKEDHAWRWAKSLAPLVGGHVLQVFKRTDEPGEQKHRSKVHRTDLKFELITPDLDNWLGRQTRRGWGIAVVDDVVTTGSTARAAWDALGQPPSLSIWALAHRITLRNGG